MFFCLLEEAPSSKDQVQCLGLHSPTEGLKLDLIWYNPWRHCWGLFTLTLIMGFFQVYTAPRHDDVLHLILQELVWLQTLRSHQGVLSPRWPGQLLLAAVSDSTV